MTCSHSELAHSTDDCCRNRISLRGHVVVRVVERQAFGEGQRALAQQARERSLVLGSSVRDLCAPAPTHLCEGAACCRTIRIMSSGVESASPLRA